MLAFDEDALICDLAETYNIYNMRLLSVNQVATFAIGLRDDARIVQKAAGVKAEQSTILSAVIVDRLSTIATALGAKNAESLAAQFYDETKQKKTNVIAFDSVEDLKKALGYGG